MLTCGSGSVRGGGRALAPNGRLRPAACARMRLGVSSRRGWGPAAINRGCVMRKAAGILIAMVSICAGLLAQGQPPLPGPDLYSRLRWRYIGPEGNRTDAVAGVPGDPLVYYVGAASGGIFKTTDGGIHLESIFDV